MFCYAVNLCARYGMMIVREFGVYKTAWPLQQTEIDREGEEREHVEKGSEWNMNKEIFDCDRKRAKEKEKSKNCIQKGFNV